MAGRKYANQKTKRKIFGGGKGTSGLWGMGSSDKSMAKAKSQDKDSSDQAEFNRRMKNPRNADKSIHEMSKGLFSDRKKK